ncbi:exo-beta 1,3 glucanase-like protein [Corynespora cassiicola Philippines]|uniref:Exo-beta 1,3 glucanase-like protein n=1 Tax=Corynespora cassiicola Philippines TaxID=1448308 RepID=A0A2T2P2W5_CORCC|nr:exo-beta 1,3 glucanase-like protein [Corynespora cassiicola Philippines]
MRFLALFSCLVLGTQAVVLPTTPHKRAPVPLPGTEEANTAPAVYRRQNASSYWLADIPHQGLAAFNPNPANYKVWRNVKDYGAKGDGVTDDSAAINRAITEGDRCGPWVCDSSTDTPAVIYFPPGTYNIAKPIVLYYMTMLHSNPNDRAVLKADPSLTALALIDASPYQDGTGEPGWTSTNTFLRQIRNLVIDLTPIPATKGAQGIHWPASQATTIQNVKIVMNQSPDSVHAGIFVENGSGGHMADLEIEGGLYGINIGNQQFTIRNVKISKAVTAISQIWNWGFLYSNLQISDCGTAFSMTGGASAGKLEVGSVVIIDSQISNTPTFVDQAWSRTTTPTGAGQLILENIALSNVPVAVKGPSGTVLQGGSTTIKAWGQGNKYTPDGPEKFQGNLPGVNRPAGLLDGDKIHSVSKPQYEHLSLDSIISARSAGAKGDGKTDDTTAVQNAINRSVQENKVLFFDHGNYKVTDTIYVPPGARMVGEAFSVVLANGPKFGSNTEPHPVFQIGKPGESGSIEWSDMIVATQGPTPGAVLIEYNLKTTKGSGLWDVHTRIGGAKGTELQVAECPILTVKDECMAAYMNVHVTKDAANAYFENNWFWTADHDLDDWNSTRTAIFTGRGLLIESANHWLWGNGVEHHALYQYQFANAKDIFAGFIQTETPYYMPEPDAKSQPYPLNAALNDPDYAKSCPPGICDAWGLRVLNSQNVLIYGGGLYSFFKVYSTDCSRADAPNGLRECQNQIFSVEGNSTLNAYALSQVGALQMLTINGVDKAKWSDNLSVYSNTIGLITV